jgi:hypothetical protein
MSELHSAEQARRMAAYWADEGVTSFKAYMYITRDELKAAIDEAHRRGLKVTGHLCSVTYPEAVALGIDDLEHGFFVNTQLDPGKKPDTCPDSAGDPTLAKMGEDPSERRRAHRSAGPASRRRHVDAACIRADCRESPATGSRATRRHGTPGTRGVPVRPSEACGCNA